MPRIGYLEVIPDSAKERKNHDRRERASRLLPRTRNRELGPLDLESSEYLELEGALGALRDVLVKALLGIVRQLEGDLGGAAGPRHQQQQREQPAAPKARGGRPALRGPRPRHPEAAAAASEELRGDAGSGLSPGGPRRRTAESLRGERAAGCRRAVRRDRDLAPRSTYRAEVKPAQNGGKGPKWPEVGRAPGKRGRGLRHLLQQPGCALPGQRLRGVGVCTWKLARGRRDFRRRRRRGAGPSS